VLELDPQQVKVIGTPLKWENEQPISREQQGRNMGNFLTKLSADLGVPAMVVAETQEAAKQAHTGEAKQPNQVNDARTAEGVTTNKNEGKDDRKERGNGEQTGAREGGSRNKPVKLERGILRAFLWDHGPDREPSATFNRIYKHDAEWKYTQSFRPIDLGDLAQLVHDVEQKIEHARAKEGNRSADNKERKRANDQEQDR
jgi:hypothetical protein